MKKIEHMNKNVVVIGGGPAGIITALTAKSVYPEKSVCVVKEIGDGVIPCAIPYMIRTLSDPEQNRMGDAPLNQAGVEVLVDKVVDMDPKAATLTLVSGKTLSYERCVLATGSTPALPPVPGAEKPGVFVIEKSLSAMRALRERALGAKRIVVLGGGFIGVEFADELCRSSDAEVHIVEILPRILSAAFDDEFCELAEQEVLKSGVHIHAGQRAEAIEGREQLESVVLADGQRIKADLVLVGVGGRPNVELARRAGLRLSLGGSIQVDSYMRTSAPNVFAAGDCAEKRDFFTRRETPVWLASTATAEARIAGTNIYGIRVLRQIQGTIAAFSTRIGNLSFASAGLTCRACERESFRVVSATAAAPDRHPGMLPGAAELRVKLVFADRAGTLLGGQMTGGPSVGELINAVAIGIQKGLNVRELDMMQIATHPLLTSAPTVHPLIQAAHRALAQLRSASR